MVSDEQWNEERLVEIQKMLDRWERGEIDNDEMVRGAAQLSSRTLSESGERKINQARAEVGLQGPYVRRASWKDVAPEDKVQVLAKVTSAERDSLYLIARSMGFSFSLFLRAIAQGRLLIVTREEPETPISPS